MEGLPYGVLPPGNHPACISAFTSAQAQCGAADELWGYGLQSPTPRSSAEYNNCEAPLAGDCTAGAAAAALEMSRSHSAGASMRSGRHVAPARRAASFCAPPLLRRSRPTACLVDGCGAELPSASRRLRACARHMQEHAVVLDARQPHELSRFCAACCKFEPLASFAGAERSCRASFIASREHERLGLLRRSSASSPLGNSAAMSAPQCQPPRQQASVPAPAAALAQAVEIALQQELAAIFGGAGQQPASAAPLHMSHSAPCNSPATGSLCSLGFLAAGAAGSEEWSHPNNTLDSASSTQLAAAASQQLGAAEHAAAMASLSAACAPAASNAAAVAALERKLALMQQEASNMRLAIQQLRAQPRPWEA